MSIRLFFNGDVTGESMDALVETLAESLDQLGEGDERLVTLYVTTDGGDLFEALGAYDHIRSILHEKRARLTTVAKGYVFSAGNVLLLAGDRRVSFAHTSFMLHEPWQYPWGKNRKIQGNEMQARLRIHALSIQHLTDIFVAATGHPREQWENFFASPADHYFDAAVALEMGLIDEVV